MQFSRLMKTWFLNGATLTMNGWLPTPTQMYDNVPLIRLEPYKTCLIYMTLTDNVPRVLRVDEDTPKRDDSQLVGQGACDGVPVDFAIEDTMPEQYRDVWSSWSEDTDIDFRQVEEMIALSMEAIDNEEHSLYEGPLGTWVYLIDSVLCESGDFMPTCMLLFRMAQGKAISGEVHSVPGMSRYVHNYEKMLARARPNRVLKYLEGRQLELLGQSRVLSERIEVEGWRVKWHVLREVFIEHRFLRNLDRAI